MHHVTLDRAGADDRDLDNEIVETFRLESRQHAHLRPALDLEDAERIGAAQHLVHGRHFARHACQRVAWAAVPCDQIECFADACQHAQRQDIDLEDAERVEIVLVPFDHRAIGHGGVGNRHYFVEASLGDDEAADMLREVTREAGEFARKPQRQIHPWRVRIDAGSPEMRAIEPVPAPAPDRIGEFGDDVLRQAERLADIPDRALGAVADDSRCETRALAAVFCVDVLDHLLASLVLEIDIDVRGLVARRRYEPLEEQIHLGRIDGGDADGVADGGIRRRAAALAKNAP